MAIKLEIEIQGEILQVRDNHSTKGRSLHYPGGIFLAQGRTFTYDELRGMGNGTHLLKGVNPTATSGASFSQTGDEKAAGASRRKTCRQIASTRRCCPR